MNLSSLGNPITNPPLGFRFGVSFLLMGVIPQPVDIRFQSVTGMGVKLITETYDEGFTDDKVTLPKKLEYDNLLLKRGVLLGSPISQSIERIFNKMQISPCDVLLFVLNESLLPVKTWRFKDAYPTRWSVSGVDATQSSVLIEEIEMTYRNFSTLTL